MSFLFAPSTPTYAQEQLSSQLSALSTLPLTISSSSSLRRPPPPSGDTSTGTGRDSPRLSDLDQKYIDALTQLSGSDISSETLIEVLSELAEHTSLAGYSGSGNEGGVDQAVKEEVMGRAVTIAWKEVMETLIKGALRVEEEKSWWESSVNSRRGVGIYLIQSLPIRLYRSVDPESFTDFISSIRNLQLQIPSRTALFRPLPNASSALTSITSPYALTRREMLSTVRALEHKRSALAKRIGALASEGPSWGQIDSSGASISNTPTAEVGIGNGIGIQSHSDRIFGVLNKVLDVPPPAISPTTPSKRRSTSTSTALATSSSSSAATASATPASLLTLLTSHLPRMQQNINQTLSTHGRPSSLTRLWFPLLFLPPVLLTTTRALVKNKAWLEEQVKQGKETIRGFVIQWVWEPLEDIGKTLRSGGEGLGVAPTTVKSDQESLERMVLDLGRDYYKLSGPQLDSLSVKVRSGDMEEVLRVYEKELQSPVKNALMGSLIRTLLIQVQKTKTDLSLSLLSLDHLLRSQQLTFAFVGVAPSFLVLYGLAGWVRGVWRGDKRGKGRRRVYFNGLREIERILLTAPKQDDEMTDKDRGLLIVSVTGMRTWAAGLGGNKREAFMSDLRLVEDPALSRGAKLRVVERIWRCFGVDGRARV